MLKWRYHDSLPKAKNKICFVICPIDAEGTEVRKRSDQILNYVIKPTVAKFGYKALRADRIAESGLITPQIIEHILNDDLVIADLTFRNPNVFYELAIRHAARKPVIQIKDPLEKIPFDVNGMRTIDVDFRFIESMDKCKQDLLSFIETIEKDPTKVITPITYTLNLKSGKESKEQTLLLNIASQLQELKSEVNDIQLANAVSISGSVNKLWAPTFRSNLTSSENRNAFLIITSKQIRN